MHCTCSGTVGGSVLLRSCGFFGSLIFRKNHIIVTTLYISFSLKIRKFYSSFPSPSQSKPSKSPFFRVFPERCSNHSLPETTHKRCCLADCKFTTQKLHGDSLMFLYRLSGHMLAAPSLFCKDTTWPGIFVNHHVASVNAAFISFRTAAAMNRVKNPSTQPWPWMSRSGDQIKGATLSKIWAVELSRSPSFPAGGTVPSTVQLQYERPPLKISATLHSGSRLQWPHTDLREHWSGAFKQDWVSRLIGHSLGFSINPFCEPQHHAAFRSATSNSALVFPFAVTRAQSLLS